MSPLVGPLKQPGAQDLAQILLCDSCTTRISSVLCLLSRLGGSVTLLTGESFCSRALLRGPGVFLIALGDNALFAERLCQIERAKQAGFVVLAYEDGVESWSIDRRCRPLMAGAARVIDSRAATFSAELEAWLEGALGEQASRAAEDAQAKDALCAMGIIGESPAMISTFRSIVRVARLSELPVLLSGETGTGKELLARAIHRLDPKRASAPLIAVNTSAIPGELAESELFGHRKGAFTGASRDRLGLIRAAQGGVLFLDEIGDLDYSIQAKLLRVLQGGRVLGIGEDVETSVDVRVVAATNRDLPEMVQSGTFRVDLFHRLCVVPIHIAPLRDRREDLEPLVRSLLVKHACLTPWPVHDVSASFFDALRSASLPGNVRQLENIIQWVLVQRASPGPLTISDLPPEIWRQISQAAAHPETPPRKPPGSATDDSTFQVIFDQYPTLAGSLEYCERRIVECALQREKGNQARAARLLGVTPRSIYNKIRKYSMRAAQSSPQAS